MRYMRYTMYCPVAAQVGSLHGSVRFAGLCTLQTGVQASGLPAPAAMARLGCCPVQEVFWQIDKDKSGTLEPTELRDALLKLGIPVPGEADFQALFDASDINKHGHIAYVEFVATMLDSDRVARWAGVDCLGCLQAPFCTPRSWTCLGDFSWAVSSLDVAFWLWQKMQQSRQGQG